MSALLAFMSALIPLFAGTVDWHQALSFHLDSPFPGHFGAITSAMAGLYLVGFAAPAFEAAACHVGETVDPVKNIPRAMYASAGMATLYFLVLPVVWLGAIGPRGLGGDLAVSLGPTFAPLLGALGKSAAIWFMMFNMFHGTLAPLTGVARTLSQLSEDGLLPEIFARRTSHRLPVGRHHGDRRVRDRVSADRRSGLAGRRGQLHLPHRHRAAQRRGVAAAARSARTWRGPTARQGARSSPGWWPPRSGASRPILGFQQFGLPTVILGLALAYSGAALYAVRKWRDRRQGRAPRTRPLRCTSN